jgi:hypothetical protein
VFTSDNTTHHTHTHYRVTRSDYQNTEEFLQKLADNLDAKVKTLFVRSNAKL